LQHTTDNGDIEFINGQVTMTGRFGTAIYLSMFGGNDDDPAGADKALQWWGNIDETEEVNQYRCETEYLLRSIPATSGNLLRIKNAVQRDTAWFLSEKIASSIEIAVSIPGLNRVNIVIEIEALGVAEKFEYTENWEAAA
ncbi:MAG: hypothetical protein GY841_22230, partial [FCB group bacterium]|nr:hypothetical protein [FCB group bacterium]